VVCPPEDGNPSSTSRGGRESNLRLSSRKSSALTTRLRSHLGQPVPLSFLLRDVLEQTLCGQTRDTDAVPVTEPMMMAFVSIYYIQFDPVFLYAFRCCYGRPM